MAILAGWSKTCRKKVSSFWYRCFFALLLASCRIFVVVAPYAFSDMVGSTPLATLAG